LFFFKNTFPLCGVAIHFTPRTINMIKAGLGNAVALQNYLRLSIPWKPLTCIYVSDDSRDLHQQGCGCTCAQTKKDGWIGSIR